MNVMISIDGTSKEIADLLFAVRNRLDVEKVSPLSTLEDSVKAVFSVDNEKLKKDIRKAIDDTLEEEPE